MQREKERRKGREEEHKFGGESKNYLFSFTVVQRRGVLGGGLLDLLEQRLLPRYHHPILRCDADHVLDRALGDVAHVGTEA